jgi:hypothetical protein
MMTRSAPGLSFAEGMVCVGTDIAVSNRAHVPGKARNAGSLSLGESGE